MMKITSAAILAIIAILAVVSGIVSANDPSVAQSGVVDLTPENFDAEVGKDKGALVEFYAPWCGHCKNMVPEFAKLGKAAAGNSKIIVGKVNADAHGELGSRFGVSGFPTIKYFPAGSQTAEDYNGGRDATSFIKFLNEKASAGLFLPYEHSDVTVISSLGQHDKLVKDASKKLVFVEYYAEWCGHCKSLAPAWSELGKIFKNDKNVVIAKCDADKTRDVANAVGVQGFPTLKYYVEGGAAQDFNGGRTVEDLVAFVNEKAGTQRAADGGLAATAGTTPELIELAGKFIAASGDARAEVKKQIDAAATGASEWFAKVANSIATKGDNFVETELARITKMLEGGKLSAAKRDSMSLKRNALNAFKK